jgi:hypothetical protein
VVEGVGKLGKLLPQLVVLLLPHFLLKYDIVDLFGKATNITVRISLLVFSK